MKLSEKEFFAARAPEIAATAGAHRKNADRQRCEAEDPPLWDAFRHGVRRPPTARATCSAPRAAATRSCGRGDVNTYAVFAEACATPSHRRGRLGVIVPDRHRHRRHDQVLLRRLRRPRAPSSACSTSRTPSGALRGVVHRRFKFCLLTLERRRHGRPMLPSSRSSRIDAADLDDPDRQFHPHARRPRIDQPEHADRARVPLAATPNSPEASTAVFRYSCARVTPTATHGASSYRRCST